MIGITITGQSCVISRWLEDCQQWRCNAYNLSDSGYDRLWAFCGAHAVGGGVAIRHDALLPIEEWDFDIELKHYD